ncbi:MAG: ImmA/IrrE family metallo-endopeptidase [SAR202 cluster bacterium]|nr:ImmA/IrrE family metallo-endopeptidase [SAR202 cluster bacterium]
MIAEARADELSRVLKLRGFVDIESVVNMLGLRVYERDMDPELQEVKSGALIAVRKDLPPEWKRFVIAHAIGHHQLHVGNHVFMRKVTTLGDPIEHQADAFALRLLVNPRDVIRENLHETWEIAEHFGVPEEIIRVQGILL